jgi:hypothetical protein
MGWRFRRGLRIAPSLRLNLSKRGASFSVGKRGFTTNLGRRGVRTTFGLPGSGLSYTTRPLGARRGRPAAASGIVTLLIAAALLYWLLL